MCIQFHSNSESESNFAHIMDYHKVSSNSSIALIMAFLTFMIILATQRYNKMTSNSGTKLPPGPRRLPIIGNLHQLISSLPHHRFADLAKIHGPVMYLKIGEVGTVVVSSNQAAEEVLRTNDLLLAQRPFSAAAAVMTYNLKGIVMSPYGVYWRHARKICVVHLTSAKRVELFRTMMEAKVAMFVRSISGSSNDRASVDLSKILHSITTNIMFEAAFGNSCKQVDKFAHLMTRISGIFSRFSISDAFPSVGVLQKISGVRDKIVRLHQEIDNEIESIIAEYKVSKEAQQTRANNILGVLLDLQDQGDPEVSLSADSIKAILLDLLFAGTDTSATVLEWTMSELMKHPKVIQKVQAEVRQVFLNTSGVNEASLHQLKYMNAVIKETLRLHPPVPMLLPREAQQSVKINGYEIPPKTIVFVHAWAIGRDPEIWTDAEKFHPERFLETSVDYKGGHLELIPFGAGRRMCPGMMFGMSTVELTLANLLYHFNWELPDGMKPECLDMSEVAGAVVRRKHDLCLIATPFRP